MTDLLDEHVLSWIGKSILYPARPPVLARDIERYAVSIGETDRIYFDEAAAHAAGFHAIPAPLGYLYWSAHPWCLPLPLDALRVDGTPEEADPLRPPLAATRVIRGGDEYRYYRRIFAGDRIVLSRRVHDIYEKRGGSGSMVFVIEAWGYSTSKGDKIADQIITRIYR